MRTILFVVRTNYKVYIMQSIHPYHAFTSHFPKAFYLDLKLDAASLQDEALIDVYS